MRWTYAGALDDMVERYRWQGIKVSKRSLDIRLAYSVVTGTPMLLNDGYLILNPACFESLGDEGSPLRVLLNQRYIRILSRNRSPSLVDVVTTGKNQGIATYNALLADKKKWTATQKTLEDVESNIRDKSVVVGWPRLNLTHSYLELMRFLAQLPFEQIGLDKVPEATFKQIVDRFDTQVTRDPSTPRSKWEVIARQQVTSDRGVLSLMQLGNEVYHHNFGVALAARPPDDMPEEAEVAVQTRMSRAFLSLYKSHTPTIPDASALPPPVTLPAGVDYSNGNLFLALFNDEQPLGRSRREYLRIRAQYLTGTKGADGLLDATRDYQEQLDNYLTSFSAKGKIATHATNFALTSGTVLLAIAGIGTAPVPTIAIGAVTFLASEFGIPNLMEKWHVSQDLDQLTRAKHLKSPQWEDAVSNRRVLSALPVDSAEAGKLVKQLPAFT